MTISLKPRQIRRGLLRRDARTSIMGILNITPDSFYDKGKFFNRSRAVERGLEMAREGADIIDIGGESTRPGSDGISTEEELERVMPVIEGLSRESSVMISVDTSKSKVAESAIKAGAEIVNDVSGLRHDRSMAGVVARNNASIIVMHMKGTPKDMQAKPSYNDLIGEIISSLSESIDIAKSAGIPEDDIIIDPGIGFGKTVEHNLEIINRLEEFKALNCPVCIGTSRKYFIGKVLGLDDAADRLTGSIATYAAAILNGANILRVHDVKEAVQAARMTDSIINGKIRD